MAFKMKGFSPFDKEHGDKPTAGTIVGDIDNKLNDAYESGDMQATKKALREINKDINRVIKSGGEEELLDYINPANYANLKAYTAKREEDNVQKEE
tara:strand:- start:748 stop:1035 length:288 start_codon:yes stop_codon:yes gene_type:complete